MHAPKFWIVSAFNPSGPAPVEIRIYHQTLVKMEEEGPEYVFWAVKSAKQTLESPTGVFRGLKREGHDEWVCYCGLPFRYTNRNVECPPTPGHVFLVFVSKGRVLKKYRWEKCDPIRQDLPEGWNERFDEPLWLKTSSSS